MTMIRDTESIYAVADSLMTQMVEVLSNTITTSEQLTHESSLIPGSTIGKHLRHIHDHFRLLLDALLLNSHSTADITNNNQSKQDDQAVQFSYDIRSRNLPSETIHSAALESFISLGKRIEVETGKGRNLVGNDQIILNAIIPYPVTLETTVAREFWFTCLHATHHFALLRVIAVGELGLSIPADFGVAPSTLASRK